MEWVQVRECNLAYHLDNRDIMHACHYAEGTHWFIALQKRNKVVSDSYSYSAGASTNRKYALPSDYQFASLPTEQCRRVIVRTASFKPSVILLQKLPNCGITASALSKKKRNDVLAFVCTWFSLSSWAMEFCNSRNVGLVCGTSCQQDSITSYLQ